MKFRHNVPEKLNFPWCGNILQLYKFLSAHIPLLTGLPLPPAHDWYCITATKNKFVAFRFLNYFDAQAAQEAAPDVPPTMFWSLLFSVYCYNLYPHPFPPTAISITKCGMFFSFINFP
jgi:hypothetical protein